MAKAPTPLALRTRSTVLRLRHPRRVAACAAGPEVQVMGLAFPGPVGLAAGFDRHGTLVAAAQRLDLAAVEVGTLFGGRRRCRGRAPAGPGRRPRCGVSLGKHPDTSWERAEDDFLAGFAAHAARADYVTLNPGRDCPGPARFAEVVARLARARGDGSLPLVAKLPAAWLQGSEAAAVAARLVAAGADGLLVSAEGAADPLGTLRRLAAVLGPAVCLISVGGVHSATEALARLAAGARLVQVHRGLVHRGIALVDEINRACQVKRLQR
jgi:dihydroorotate dehydrogenase